MMRLLEPGVWYLLWTFVSCFKKGQGMFMLNCGVFSPESHAFNLTGRFEDDKQCPSFIRLLSSSVVESKSAEFQCGVDGVVLLALFPTNWCSSSSWIIITTGPFLESVDVSDVVEGLARWLCHVRCCGARLQQHWHQPGTLSSVPA